MVCPRCHWSFTDEQGNELEIALNGDFLDQGIYRYILPGQNILSHAVEVVVA